MMYVRKLSFSIAETEQILKRFDGYVWAAVDLKRKIAAIGDESVDTLKYALLGRKCRPDNIYGVGIDIFTGEIDYVSPINKRLLDKASTKFVPVDKIDKIETLIKYFFSELPVFKAEKSRPRYTKPRALPSTDLGEKQ